MTIGLPGRNEMERHLRNRPRIFNTALESGMRSLILLTACFPEALSLRKLVVLDHLIVHTSDIDGPSSLHPREDSRAAELLVRRRLVSSGLSLMGTKSLVQKHATASGFKYQAGEEAGTFVDFLTSEYSVKLKERANWLATSIVPLPENEFETLVRQKIEKWEPEFQYDNGAVG
jgi:hypothetical protein